MPQPLTHKPFVIPIFIPNAGCPHRCVFCNQAPITGRAEKLPGASQLHKSITQFLSYRRDSSRHTEISFFGGNFLGLAPDTIAAASGDGGALCGSRPCQWHSIFNPSGHH